MKKRLFALLLTLCLVVSLLPAQNVTAEGANIMPLGEAVTVTIPMGETVSYSTALLAAGTGYLDFTVQGSIYCEIVNDDTGNVHVGGSVSDNTRSWDIPLDMGTYTIKFDNTTGITDAQVTATLTAPTPVALSVGSNSVTLPAGGSVSCTVTPVADSAYATYLFYVENGYKDWLMTIPNDGLSVNNHETNTAFGYNLWLYGEAVPTALTLINTGSEDVTLPLCIAKSTDATDVVFTGVEANANIGETKRVKLLATTSTGRIGMVDWSVEGPAQIKPDDYDLALAEVTFTGTGDVTIKAEIGTLEDSFTKTFVVSVIDPSDNGDNGNNDGGNTNNVTVIAYESGMEATYTISHNGQAMGQPTDGVGVNIPAGSTLTAAGYSISAPVFWDSSRQFLGWDACTLEPFYNEGTLMGYDYVTMEGTSRMTNAQMQEFVIPADIQVYFVGAWAGDDEDYFSSVAFDGFDGNFDVYYGTTHYSNASWESWNCRENTVISTEAGRYHDSTMSLQNIQRDGKDVDGWIQYTMSGDGNWQMVERDQALRTDEVLAMTVAEDDMLFVAYWADKSWDEYLNYGRSNDGGGEGGEGGWGDDFQLPDGMTPVPLTLNEKEELIGDWSNNYYSFTAPDDGHYFLCVDSVDFGCDFRDANGMGWINPSNGKMAMYREAGEEYIFALAGGENCNVWIEKAPAVTKLEVLSYDNTKVFARSDEVDGYELLRGATIKATFANNTSCTVTLPDPNTYWTVGGYDLEIGYDLPASGDVGTVWVRCGGKEASFTVKLLNKTVTSFEVITEKTPLEVVENSIGWYWENGTFAYDLSYIMSRMVSYKFTFSDGTSETVTFEPDQMYYYGIEIRSRGTNEWEAGNTYTLDAVYGDLTAPLQVKVVEFPAKKIEVLDAPTVTLGEPYFYKETNGKWEFNMTGIETGDYAIPALENVTFKVTYKDDSTKTFKISDADWIFEEPFVEFMRLSFDVPNDYDGLTGAIDLPMTLHLGDLEADFTLKIVEKVVENNQTTVAPSVVEDALSNKGQTGNKVVVDASSSNADETDGSQNVNGANLPAASVEKVADANVDMTVKLDNAEVTFDKSAVDAIAGAEVEEITLEVKVIPVTQLTDKQQHKIESVLKNQDQNPLVLDITLKADGALVSDFEGGKVTIRVPFTPPAGTKGEDYTVFYVPDNPNAQVQRMKTTYENGYLVFTTSHFSDYVALSNTPENTIDDPGLSQGGNGNQGGGSQGGSSQGGKTPAPDTADNANIFGFVAMMVMSGMLAAAFLSLRKRTHA